MKNTLELNDRLNSVFRLIEDAINDDNIITEEEFQKIQAFKKELNISSKCIHDKKKIEIERILYLQFYLLLLDDDIDINERKEVEYYREIFGYSEEDMYRIEKQVRKDKSIKPFVN